LLEELFMEKGLIIRKTRGAGEAENLAALREVLNAVSHPFHPGMEVGIKIHWGEKGNRSFLPASYTREIVLWLQGLQARPFVFDTSVLYSGGRRNGAESLVTARRNGFSEETLGCPVRMADGLDGRDVGSIPAGMKHFSTVQVANVVGKADGFVIFSHFKGHLASSFGGAIKNISMGFASRAQKQRMHSDAHPVLKKAKCTRCGLCVEVCPAGAATVGDGGYPVYDLGRCIGCNQCIALCAEAALKIFWDSDPNVFQEKLVETAAAVWKAIGARSIAVNALVGITKECDCMPGENPAIAKDIGFVGGSDPVAVDRESLALVGMEPFENAHPGIPWKRQFEHAAAVGFGQEVRGHVRT